MCESFKSKIRVFFEQAETDGVEGLSIQELARAIRENTSFQGTDADIADMFVDLDKSGDQLITWDEFSGELSKKNPKEVKRCELEDAFKKMDKDGSGKLDRSELKALIQKLGIQCSEEAIDNSMAAADPNGDGVDMCEFLKAWNGE